MLPVSVNLSRCHLPEEDTVERIMAIVQRYGIEPSLLEFELTETVDNEDYRALEALMAELHAHGLRTSIDDFGTGYSNFDYIMKLNVDFLKIDASIIKNIVDDKSARIITETIVTFCRKMGIFTVAEYVHTRDVYELVQSLGID